MINVQNISFHYSKHKRLFENLCLSLEPGNVVGLFGRNGAGKTTLIKILAGLIFTKSGEVEVLNHNPALRQPSFLSQTFFLPEEVGEYAGSIKNYVALHSHFYSNFNQESFLDMIHCFGLVSEDELKNLSFGQRKQFYISFGLATGCRFIIMDEPTNGLDIPSKRIFRQLIASSITESSSILISTHQVRDLGNLIDRVVILDNGKIVFNHTIDQISKSFQFVNSDRQVDNRDEIIYQEEYMNDKKSIIKSSGDKLSKVDFEMLFSGVVMNPENFKISENA